MKSGSILATSLGALLLFASIPAVASAAPTAPAQEITSNTAPQELAPFANSNFSWKVRCPVERIRDTNIVGVITEYGKTKTIAVAKANARVFAEYGVGYRLHHCTPTQFSGSGGSSGF